MDERKKFDRHIISDYVLKTKSEEIVCAAIDFLTSKRIDLIAKYIYIEAKDKSIGEAFARELYKAHISAFSLGKFVEPGQEDTKNSMEAYESQFLSLIEGVAQKGFDSNISIIPADENNIIMDGAHRTAICIYYNLPIKVCFFQVNASQYDYKFFKKRLLSERYLDYMITHYLKVKKGKVFTACLWPVAYSMRKAVRKTLEESVTVVYEKEVSLTRRGAHSFLSQIYSRDIWIGTPSDRYKGVYEKLNPCFADFKNPLTLLVIEIHCSTDLIDLKKTVREFFTLGKHSIHITDTFEESEQIAELLLNNNSIHHLNFGNPFRFKDTIPKILELKQYLIEKSINIKNVIVDSSTAMEVYGIREGRDVDFISRENIDDRPPFYIRTEKYIAELYSNIDLEDPNSYFFYQGIKFTSLQVVRDSKRNRGELKDIGDIRLIDSFLGTSNSSLSKFDIISINFKRKIVYQFYILRPKLYTVLKRLGLINVLKKVIH